MFCFQVILQICLIITRFTYIILRHTIFSKRQTATLINRNKFVPKSSVLKKRSSLWICLGFDDFLSLKTSDPGKKTGKNGSPHEICFNFWRNFCRNGRSPKSRDWPAKIMTYGKPSIL